MVWTPYRNLIYYVYSRLRKNLSGETVRGRLQSRAESYANDLLITTHSRDRICAEFKWPQVSETGPLSLQPFSRKLQVFLNRGHHRYRRALEELIMYYAISGWDRKEAIESAYEEYLSIEGHAPDLTIEDVTYFVKYFWDWFVVDATEIAAQGEYVKRYAKDNLYDIYAEDRTIEDIRSEYKMSAYYNGDEALRRRAALVSAVAETGMRHAYEKLRRNDMYGLERLLAAFSQANDSALKHDAFIKEMDLDSASGQTLADYIINEIEENGFDVNPYDYSQSTEITPEDLRAENGLFIDIEEPE